MAKAFRDLRVWQSSLELSLRIYALTSNFPKHEVYGLASQMRRAAVSIASNIAEGSARGSRKDFRQFVLVAKGSTCELQTQLIIAGRLGYVASDTLSGAEAHAREIARMLSGLSTFLKRTPETEISTRQSRTT